MEVSVFFHVDFKIIFMSLLLMSRGLTKVLLEKIKNISSINKKISSKYIKSFLVKLYL